MDRAHTPIGSLMEQAACLVRRSKEAAGTPELAESYKRKQTEELIKFADANSLWIDFRSLPVIYLAKGGENEVFYNNYRRRTLAFQAEGRGFESRLPLF